MTHATGTLRTRLRGQALVMFAIALTALCAAAALAVDLSGAMRAKSRLVSTNELAKDSELNSLNLVKFSEDPAQATYTLVTDALAEDGFFGTFELTYFELPESESGPADRYAGVRVELHQTYQTVLAGVIGHPTVEVADALCWSINPYSSSEVWRPASVACRRYKGSVDSAGNVSLTSTETIAQSSYDTLPEDLKQAIQSAKDSADHFRE